MTKVIQLRSRTYALRETFWSLQGEGAQTGRPSFFVRFAGCNADCPWCDTDWQRTTERLTAEQLVERALSKATRYVIFTGGEPTLQLDAFLLHRFHSCNFECAIETNGSRVLDDFEFDWICVSPKDRVERGPVPWVQRSGDELKVVWDRPDFDPSSYLREGDFTHRFVSPEWGAREQVMPSILRFLEEHPEWRLSLQTHKLLGLP